MLICLVGPSVVISTLLNLMSNKKKVHGYPVKQIVITTPIEAVIAIVLFGIFSNLEQTTKSTLVSSSCCNNKRYLLC